MIEVKVSPFGSAVALDPARRVPRNDQPAPLAVLGGCRPGHDLDPRQVRLGCLLFRPRPVRFVPLPERQPPPIFRRQELPAGAGPSRRGQGVQCWRMANLPTFSVSEWIVTTTGPALRARGIPAANVDPSIPVLWRDPIEPCGAVPPLTPSSATHLPAMRAGFPGLPLPLHREAAREAAVHDVEAIRRHPVTDRSLPGSLPRLNHAIPVALD